MAETGDGPLWLVRDEDVVSHLFFAAAEIGSATLEVGGVNISGTFSFPNAESRSISFFSTGETDLEGVEAEAGSVVRMRYSQGECAYAFLSELCEVSDSAGRRRWRVSFPTMVERNERRIVRRHRVLGRTGFKVGLDVGSVREEKSVYDISSAGVSFVVDASDKRLKLGTNFTGTVTVPGAEPIAVMLELRNMRPLPGDGKRRLAGCRFVGLAQADHEALATSLSRLA
jgi:hypothetical protein